MTWMLKSAPKISAELLRASPSTGSGQGGLQSLRATDFRDGRLRSVRPDSRAGDLYRAIAAGLGGTAMPTWKGALPEDDLWALVHYVDQLSRGAPTSAPR